MLFVTGTFAVFFAVVLVLHTLLGEKRRAWVWTMCIASFVFYGWFDPRLCLLLFGYGLITHLSGLWMGRTERKRLCAWVVVPVLLSGLIATRYLSFLADVATRGFSFFGIARHFEVSDPWLPIGISFLAFQAIGYVIDIKRGQGEVSSKFADTMLFLAFFPQLVAGPIVRARSFLPQLQAGPRREVDVTRAGVLILSGVFKKIVLSEILFTAVGRVADNPKAYGAADMVLNFVGETIRVYCDASSYADLAVGLGILLGISLPDNFRRPFAAWNMSELWRRWHLTVTNWLRDYIFVPLAGNGRGWRLVWSGLATMLVSGLWHGAGWGFLVWGLSNGVLLVIEGALRTKRQRQRRPRRKPTGLLLWLGRLYVMATLCLIGPLFTGHSISETLELWKRLAHFEAPTVATPGVLLAIGLVLVAHWSPSQWSQLGMSALRRVPLWGQSVMFGVALTVVAGLGVPGVSSYLYYRF